METGPSTNLASPAEPDGYHDAPPGLLDPLGGIRIRWPALLVGCGHGPSHPPLSIWSPPPGPNGDGGCMVSGSGPSSMAKVPPCVTRIAGQDRLLTHFVIQDVLECREQGRLDWKVPAGGSLNVPTTNRSPGWDR